jgi:hypothetical protein
MSIEEAREYALTLKGATEDMPHDPDRLVFRIGGKNILPIVESPKPTIGCW